MSQQTAVQQPPVQKKLTEEILVVKRTHLLPHESFNGFKPVDIAQYLEIIQTHKEFHPRAQMETDQTYKQIIPYMVFMHDNKLFLMQRAAKASETRLQNKYSLGIGGHVRQEDLHGATLFDWAQREFHEEINYAGNLKIEAVGLLNDDTNDVGKVHIGLVLLLHGDSADISIKSELQSGALVSFETCTTHAPAMETWSQYIFTYLNTTR